jgi:hypothetical protein
MEGYSIDEAATILGVPTGRVWELLARGVLAGTQEDGGGMRVFLRGSPPVPGAVAGVPDPGERGTNGDAHGNGSPADAAFEASPFRELLTEFRHLTERYGQALLALGEARGEVAGLRARVELLEARLDLRLPGPAGWASAWTAPPPGVATELPAGEGAGPADEREPTFDAHEADARETDAAHAEGAPVDVPEVATATSAEQEIEIDDEPHATREGDVAEDVEQAKEKPRRHHRRRRGSPSAVTGIAEALARAEDPTSASLPGAEDAAEAIAAMRREIPTGSGVPFLVRGMEPGVPEAVDELSAPTAVAPSAELPAEELEATPARAPEPTDTGSMALQPAPGPESPSQDVAEPVSAEPPEPPEPTDRVEYSSEWDEPDWIAEEDLEGGWDATVATAPQAEEAAAEPPAEAGAAPIEAEAIEAQVSIVEEPMAEPEPRAPEMLTTEAEPEAEPPAPDMLLEEPAVAVEEVILPEAEPELELTADGASALDVQPDAPRVAGEAEARQIPEMAGWPPPPDEEIAAEMEMTASPSATDTADQSASDDYLLLYEPMGQVPASEPAPLPASKDDASSNRAETSDALEEELMWLGDEFRPSSTAWKGLGESTMPSPRPPIDEATTDASREDEELERLARLRGWDEGELAAIRSLLGDQGEASPQSQAPPVEATPHRADPGPAEEESPESPSTAPPSEVAEPMAPSASAGMRLPGAAELDAAFASLRGTPEPVPAASGTPDLEQPSTTPAEAEASGEAPTQDDAARAASAGAAEHPLPAPQGEPTVANPGIPPLAPRPAGPPRMSDEDWLRGRRGPAANAYRRLRRLFPG